MTEKLTVREVWESVRPLAEAAAIVSHAGLDVMELDELENTWNTKTLPYLQELNLTRKVHEELDRMIKFAQDRIKKVELEFEQNAKTFAERRYLMEEKIPVAKKFLQQWVSWRSRPPAIQWEPADVVDIKQHGIEKFIKNNIERFYGQGTA